jgi:hypothetical protein
VLLVQSLTIGGWALTQVVEIVLKLARESALSYGPSLLTAVDAFFNQYLTLMGHILLAERILATVFAGRYEALSSPYINIGWFSVMVSFFSILLG